MLLLQWGFGLGSLQSAENLNAASFPRPQAINGILRQDPQLLQGIKITIFCSYYYYYEYYDSYYDYY